MNKRKQKAIKQRKIKAEHKELLQLANADFELLRQNDNSHSFNIRMVERHWKLKVGQLRYFRANRNRRNYGNVTLVR